jgi:hypothetical protein
MKKYGIEARRKKKRYVYPGSETFCQSARTDLDKTCEAARKKKVSGS